jgi:hypothetical protein
LKFAPDIHTVVHNRKSEIKKVNTFSYFFLLVSVVGFRKRGIQYNAIIPTIIAPVAIRYSSNHVPQQFYPVPIASAMPRS